MIVKTRLSFGEQLKTEVCILLIDSRCRIFTGGYGKPTKSLSDFSFSAHFTTEENLLNKCKFH